MYSKEQISRALSAPSDKSYFVGGYESQNDVLKAMHKALGQARDALKKALEISYNGFNRYKYHDEIQRMKMQLFELQNDLNIDAKNIDVPDGSEEEES